jgi:hypothetical protein
MTLRGSRLASPLLAAILFATSAGCPKQRSTMNRPPEINPPPPVETSAGARIDELGNLARQFAQTAERLPGRNTQEHRAAAQQAFADLSQILPVLYGPNPTGMQRQQLRVVENARTQLSSASAALAPEPTIDTGLRAARDALQGLSRNSYYDHPQLGQTLDRLDRTVSDLDASRGLRHQQVVAEVVELMSTAVNQMSDALNQRLQGDGMATQPAQK